MGRDITIKSKITDDYLWRAKIDEITMPTKVFFMIDNFSPDLDVIKKTVWNFGDGTKQQTFTNRKLHLETTEVSHIFRPKYIEHGSTLSISVSVFTADNMFISKDHVITKALHKKSHMYIDPEVFKQDIVNYYNSGGDITDEVAEGVFQIATRLAYAPNFINYCVDDQTETLTTNGWVTYDKLTMDDQILAYDTTSQNLTWSDVEDIFINTNYTGLMHKLLSPNIDALVTPGHRFVDSNNQLFPIEDISNREGLTLMSVTSSVPNIDTYFKCRYLLKQNIEDIKISKYYLISDVVWCPKTEYGTWVCKRGNKVYITGNTYREEFIGDALIKMIEALKSQKFDPEKGNPFSYFTKIAYHAFCNRIKKEKRAREALANYQEEVYESLISEGIIPTTSTHHEETE